MGDILSLVNVTATNFFFKKMHKCALTYKVKKHI